MRVREQRRGEGYFPERWGPVALTARRQRCLLLLRRALAAYAQHEFLIECRDF